MPTKSVPENSTTFPARSKNFSKGSIWPTDQSVLLPELASACKTCLCLWGLFHSFCMIQKASPVMQSLRSTHQFSGDLGYCAAN